MKPVDVYALRRGLAALVAGAALGVVLGLVAALLRVLIDPHLRADLPNALLRAAWPSAASFALGVALMASVSAGLPAGGRWGPRLRWTAGALAPLVGLALSIALSPGSTRSLDPATAGIVLTSADLLFVAVFVALTALLAVPLGRWSRGLQVRAGRGTPALALVTLAVLVLLALAVPDARGEIVCGAEARQVVLIGADGVDWRWLRPRLESGDLPSIAALVAGGASGELATFRPTESPLIWTSIATGLGPARHGITSFVDPESGVPLTSNMRRVPALWNLLGDRGVRVAVAGWWVTWPAEAVNGWPVSSYVVPGNGTTKGTLVEGLEGQTYPPELIEELRPMVQPDLDAAQAEVRKLLHTTGFAGMEPEELAKRRYVASWVFGADRIYTDVIVHLAQRHAPDLLVVYLSATDTVAHLFCEGRDPQAPVCQGMLSHAYARLDRAVERILAVARPDATVLLVSDHGFDLERGHHGRGRLMGPPGIAVLKGPGVRPGSELAAASIYDVAPTVLALLGAPVPRDLRGRALLGAFERDAVASVRPRYGPPTVAYARADAAVPIPAETDELMRERLRTLGYIE